MAVLAILGAALLSYVLWELVQSIVQAHLSPLSKLPSAGWGAAYSRLLWAFPQEFKGAITLDLPKLHKKLGPLIRIGPNEVSFYSMDVYDTVHKVKSGFQKDPRTYGQFVQGGHPALFSITHPEEHAKRRRIMGQLFSRSKMSKLEPLMLHHIEGLVNSIGRLPGPVDIGSASRALEADIISEFSFGKSLGAVAAWEKDGMPAMVANNDEKARWMPLLTSFPVLYELWSLLNHFLSVAKGQKTSHRKGLQDFDKWTDQAWTETLETRESNESPYPNLVRVLVDANLPSQTALSEAKENLGPGTDTTSGSLAHILYALAQNEDYQQNLFEDLRAVDFSTDLSVLENIPRLRACVKEGIRWGGTAAAMLPRIVPAGGVELHGKIIPEGTVLTSSPIWYLRDAQAFPNPEEFDPYRWIDGTGTTFLEDALRDKFYIPFSKGANICMGAYFSYYELYLSVSQIVKHYRLQSTNQIDSGATMRNEWVPVPLPKRKEWVAAVLDEDILVNIAPRDNLDV